MDVARRLSEFKRIDLPSSQNGLDTSFADEFLKAFTRVAKSQVKTQQAVELSLDDIRRALQGQQELVEEVKEQRRSAELKNEQLLRFLLEAVDLIFNFHKAAVKAGNAELHSASETMLAALRPNMEKTGLLPIPALGEVPDALYHFVLNTRSVDDPTMRDRIVEVVREGYVLDGSVVRKADVIVGK